MRVFGAVVLTQALLVASREAQLYSRAAVGAQLVRHEDHQVVSLINSTLAADVSVRGSFENVAVGSEEASIVATIVNELAANASKHSFKGSSGTIFLSGERVSEGGYRLVCSDDAQPGDVETVAPSGRIGLGLKILTASVRKLGGTMIATRDNKGYSTQLDFDLPVT